MIIVAAAIILLVCAFVVGYPLVRMPKENEFLEEAPYEPRTTYRPDEETGEDAGARVPVRRAVEPGPSAISGDDDLELEIRRRREAHKQQAPAKTDALEQQIQQRRQAKASPRPAAQSAQACPNCGSKVPAQAKFCPKCGRPLASGCPKCGAPFKPTDTFCSRCGANLKKGKS